ncbi:hypothetical protein BJV74DRAFT_876259 [Russula compacta]|nr:hypothetical protein BJV74DRAFT_876259 [Russula compacta]
MDNAGWQARRRAVQQEPPSRGPDGQFRPVGHLQPIEDSFIGGWTMPAQRQPSPLPTPSGSNGDAGIQSGAAAPPSSLSPHLLQTGYPFNPLSRLSAVERSQMLNRRKTLMHPYLQFMCGPLLRYDTVDEHGVWHGAAMIVTADAGSTYEPFPTLRYRWDPKRTASHRRQRSVQGAQGLDLGPHPADPMAQHYRSQADDGHLEGPSVVEKSVLGTEIYAYGGSGGTYTFWRFLMQIPLDDSEMKIQYSINDGLEIDFFVPGRRQTMRLAAYSCNGFSAGVNVDNFRGPGFQTGYDPVWVDLLAQHAEQPFHLLIGGGDQLYCDGVAREPEMQEWVNRPKHKEKMTLPLSQEMLTAIDRFYFSHYCQSFRSGAFARANSSIPMLNMLDDHDPDDLQRAPVFNAIGSRGYFFFLLFQCFINVHNPWCPGDYIPFPSHSILTPIGPKAWILMLDCRAERKLGQVCSEEEYTRVFKRLNALPPGVEHLIIQLGIPIAYPRMSFLETMLSSKFNPLVTLGRTGSLGLKGFVNKFNGDAELLDDLNDHWTSKHHMAERNWFIDQLQQLAQTRRIRISFLSGDVHCAAVGVLKTLNKGKKSSALAPTLDYRYMLNVVSTATSCSYMTVPDSRPPNGVLTLVNSLSSKRHHFSETEEEMVPLFDKDTDGSKPKSHYVMGRRNWCSITLKRPSGDLLFDIRVEKKKGHGETVGYSILAPPPRWTAKAVK